MDGHPSPSLRANTNPAHVSDLYRDIVGGSHEFAGDGLPCTVFEFRGTFSDAYINIVGYFDEFVRGGFGDGVVYAHEFVRGGSRSTVFGIRRTLLCSCGNELFVAHEFAPCWPPVVLEHSPFPL